MNKRNKRHRFLAAITVLVLVLTMLASGVSALALAPVGTDDAAPAAELTNGGGTDDVTDTETGKTDGGKEKEDAKAPEDNENDADADTVKPAEKPEEAVKDKPAEPMVGAKGGVSVAEETTVKGWNALKVEVENPNGASIITVESSGSDNPNFIRVQLNNGVTDSITVRRPVTIKGKFENGKGTTIYQPINAATAVKEYKPMFIVEGGGDLTRGDLTLGENLTLSGQMAKNPNLVTKKQFSGSVDEEKGFFVEVRSGGTFKLNGATLRDLIAGGDVEYAAPVVSHGGTVNIESGAITHNTIGYDADNSKSGEKSFKTGFESERGDFKEESGTLMAEWMNTESAGAMILTDKSSCTISGGTISQNRGDTGAIVLQGLPDNKGNTQVCSDENRSKLLITNGAISSNAGVHHAGAVYVFNGAHCQMEGGEVNDNFAWMKGGAFWISEEVYASQTVSKEVPKEGETRSVKTGNAAFVLKGGTINNNMAIKRGGGIQVQSSHVALVGGTVSSNVARELGGGIYLEGDPGRPFQMYVPQGIITNNKATIVQGDDGARLKRIFYGNGLNNDNTFVNNIRDKGGEPRSPGDSTGGDPTGNNSGIRGFWGDYGDGGGLWLCAYGGTATFDIMDNDHDVTITANQLSGRRSFGGTDVFVRNAATDAGNGINVKNLGANNHFINEDDSEEIPINAHRLYNGPLKLKNKNTSASIEQHGGVKITSNVASCGGGIAANGNVVFGAPDSTYRGGASIRITKKWAEAVQGTKPVILKLYVKIEGKEIPADDLMAKGYEVKLNGTADRFVDETEGDGEDQYTEDTPAYEVEPWVAQGGLPLNITIPGKDGKEESFPLFTFDYRNTPGDTSDDLDPTKDLETIYTMLESGKLTVKNARPTNWKMVVEEIAPDGSVLETRLVDPKDPELKAINAVKTSSAGQDDLIHYTYQDGTNIAGMGTFTIGMEFAKDVTNDLTPAAEKYVDKQKHTSMGADEVLTYDVLAYVPLDAEEFTLTDELSAPLQFCSSRGDKTTNPSKTIQSISYRQTNDHRENGSVAARPDGTVSLNDVSANISGQKLTVHLDKGKTLDKLRGKWVQLTFTANIKPGYRNSKDVLNNGVTNQAVYHVSYGSAHKSEDSVKTDVVSSEVKKASGKKAADTGDHTDAGLWIALLAASVSGIIVLTLRRRRRV
ncbi:MAG: isopeptide-forming domain-containing fimbrial protein [Clostridiales bacterium]|jgi:fimbrial isopeptide formation D2 family protein|nr:isopeptide-forming domain-containing fimbrial protein [Clostridiales bacterium]